MIKTTRARGTILGPFIMGKNIGACEHQCPIEEVPQGGKIGAVRVQNRRGKLREFKEENPDSGISRSG